MLRSRNLGLCLYFNIIGKQKKALMLSLTCGYTNALPKCLTPEFGDLVTPLEALRVEAKHRALLSCLV